MIRNIFLDADDTLFDFHLSERDAISQTLRAFGIEPAPEILRRYSEINAAYWRLLEKKEITRADLRHRRYEQLLRELNLDLPADALADCYEEELAKKHYFTEGAEELLCTLAPHYRLYLASNGYSKTQRSRLRRAGIESCFSDVFISQEIGADKPDAAYFQACFARIPDFRPIETVIVGDSLSSDISGGRNAGIRTVWYNPRREITHSETVPDEQIHHLSELPALLEQMDLQVPS